MKRSAALFFLIPTLICSAPAFAWNKTGSIKVNGRTVQYDCRYDSLLSSYNVTLTAALPGKRSQMIKEAVGFDEACEAPALLQMRDWNFDGYQDIALQVTQGNGVNAVNMQNLYLYDPNNKQFSGPIAVGNAYACQDDKEVIAYNTGFGESTLRHYTWDKGYFLLQYVEAEFDNQEIFTPDSEPKMDMSDLFERVTKERWNDYFTRASEPPRQSLLRVVWKAKANAKKTPANSEMNGYHDQLTELTCIAYVPYEISEKSLIIKGDEHACGGAARLASSVRLDVHARASAFLRKCHG